jgi:hypothetical protein
MNLGTKHFERAAQHHATLAKDHRTIASTARGSMKKAAKADGMEELDIESLAEFLEQFIESHDAIADEHEEMSEHCMKCSLAAKEAEKADSGDLGKSFSNPALQGLIKKLVAEEIGNTVRPMNVSIVAPNRPGLVAVPRAGAPAIPETHVDPQFQKLFSTGDAEPSQ